MEDNRHMVKVMENSLFLWPFCVGRYGKNVGTYNIWIHMVENTNMDTCGKMDNYRHMVNRLLVTWKIPSWEKYGKIMGSYLYGEKISDMGRAVGILT